MKDYVYCSSFLSSASWCDNSSENSLNDRKQDMSEFSLEDLAENQLEQNVGLDHIFEKKNSAIIQKVKRFLCQQLKRSQMTSGKGNVSKHS